MATQRPLCLLGSFQSPHIQPRLALTPHLNPFVFLWILLFTPRRSSSSHRAPEDSLRLEGPELQGLWGVGLVASGVCLR